MSIFTPKVSGKKELSLASDLMRQEKYEEALAMAKQALIILREKKDPKQIALATAKVLEIQAKMHEEKKGWKNAAGAFGQAGRYYKQADALSDEHRVMKKHAELLLTIGRQNAGEKKFESAASSFEEAALSYRQIGMEIDALEVRAKACVFRAASVREVNDRKRYLMQAVDLIRTSGIDNPLVLGHLNYYSAMVQRLTDKTQAIETLDTAIEYYSEAKNQALVKSAKAMQNSLRK